jgi:hypothetical protein
MEDSADWKYLAEQVSKEMDPEKLMKLVDELERLLGEREELRRQQRTITRNQDQEIKPFRAVA